MSEALGITNHEDAFKGAKNDSTNKFVHIRIQQRNGRKTLTTVQGVDPEYDFKKIVKVAKKHLNCNGTVVIHPEYGEVIQLQGDQRENIKNLLVSYNLVTKEQIKLHGF